MARLKVSDVHKKHLRIIGYLVVSIVLGYLLSLVAGNPRAIYFTPLINYVLYATQLELKKEGYRQALK